MRNSTPLRALLAVLALAVALLTAAAAPPGAAATRAPDPVTPAAGPASSAAGPASSAADPVRVMPLGDSITGSPGCWRAVLWNQLQNAGYTDIDFVGTLGPQGCALPHDGDNEGHGGYLATNVAAQNLLPGWLAATRPDVVMMHFGTNDVWSGIAPERILAAFDTLVDQMRASNPDMKVLVAQLIPMNPSGCAECAQRVVALNALIPGWAAGRSTARSPVIAVDQWSGFSTASDTYDGVHPNASGDDKIAARWFPPLSGLLTRSTPDTRATGLRVSNGRLVESNGNDFVMRGVNHAHTWFTGRTTAALRDIKALGANTVRVVLSTGDQWTRNDTADVANVVAQCKQNKLICVLEAHDTTGYGEQGAAVSLARAADYWISVRSALTGQENYVIVNIGNEPYGNSNYAGWTADTSAAVQRLRSAGFEHTLMVDAPNWGQDWSFTMRDNAASVFAADPNRNTMFSIHMYGVYDTPAKVSAYLNAFVSARLPILVGEFGDMHSDGNPDEDAIMATTQSLGLGYLGWSWSGNGGGVEYLDMAYGFDPNSLSAWGQRIFRGANGIAATSRQATVYGG